jgi:SAM-dependent methyltransferase
VKSAELNSYSRRWFEFFHDGIDEERTFRETEFICRCAPSPEFREILDVCCGKGRHACALASHGYSVTGIDRDAGAIATARTTVADACLVVADIRNYEPEPGRFDGAIVMGQSFGHFDAQTNRDVLNRLANGLREDGRVVLDLWNREFFAAHQGERELTTPRGSVRERKRVDGDRLFVKLTYPDGAEENFGWQLFTEAQMNKFAKSAGLSLILSCAGFDYEILPSPANPRIQFVLARR